MPGRAVVVTVVFLVVGAGSATAQDFPWAFVVKGNFTTSSQVYDNPNAPDPVDRSKFVDLTDFFGFGVEIKYQIPETNIALGISVDRLRARAERPLFDTHGPYVPIEDGYEAVSIELTGYFIIPASGGTFGVFMGGGLGIYVGRRIYSWGGMPSDLIGSEAGFGIHVLAGGSVRLAKHFSLITEMKFRDLQFKSANRFSAASVDYEGVRILLPAGQLDSNVHTDGITFQIGLAFNF